MLVVKSAGGERLVVKGTGRLGMLGMLGMLSTIC